MKASNKLRFSIWINKGDTDYNLVIKLDDECKNGHQDFSVVAGIYPKGFRSDRSMNGWINGDSVGEKFPEFKIFADLHLCDWNGYPMYAYANGFYHLREGFSNVKPSAPEFPAMFCEHYNIPLEFFDFINKAQSKVHYAIILKECKIPELWNKKAAHAIAELEKLAGQKFLVDSVRTNLDDIKPEEFEAEYVKLENGYYSEKAKTEREDTAREKMIQGLRTDAMKKVEEIERSLEVSIELIKAGGKAAYDSAIYYNHTNTIKFNWKSYGSKLSQSEADYIMQQSPILADIKYEVINA